MLQFIPLLIELILLGAVGYIYWRTRQLIANTRSQALPSFLTRNQVEQESNLAEVRHVEMMHEVANLLTEWQTAASTARNEWIQQQASLQETLKQAESRIVELQMLITQAERREDEETKTPEPKQSNIQKVIPSPGQFPETLPDTWTEAIAAFGAHLQASGYTPNTITRTLSHLEKFAVWWTGRSEAELLPHRQEVMGLESPGERGQSSYSAGPSEVILAQSSHLHPSSNKMLLTQGADRYRTVFALAEQGLDPVAITAETGLEREVVRLLLTNYGAAISNDS